MSQESQTSVLEELLEYYQEVSLKGKAASQSYKPRSDIPVVFEGFYLHLGG